MATSLHITIRNYKGLHKNSQLRCIILIKESSTVYGSNTSAIC